MVQSNIHCEIGISEIVEVKTADGMYNKISH